MINSHRAKTSVTALPPPFALAAMPLAAAGAKAADYDVGSIHISQPWARATPKGASSGAGYMTVTNNGTAPIV